MTEARQRCSDAIKTVNRRARQCAEVRHINGNLHLRVAWHNDACSLYDETDQRNHRAVQLALGRTIDWST